MLSSQIEGTQSSLSDLLLFENESAPGVPMDDVEETSNYITAMNHGLRRMRSGELPLSNRLLREVHAELMRGVRGADKAPGEFRRSQNWLGGTRPGNAHPFLDGNGRVGRLLITLLLCADGVLQQPLLYLSLYFKQHRDLYYDHLQRVRTEGAWEEWLVFFLEGVVAVAGSATDTARRIRDLVDRDRAVVNGFGRSAGSAVRVHEHAAQRILVTAKGTATSLALTAPTVNAALARLEEAGILREVTGRRRGRVFAYDEYLALLQEER